MPTDCAGHQKKKFVENKMASESRKTRMSSTTVPYQYPSIENTLESGTPFFLAGKYL